MTDFITVLTSKGPLLTKQWTADGIKAYDRAKHFSVDALDVHDIRGLSKVLTVIEVLPMACVIRGLFKGESTVYTPRDLESFADAAHRWVCLDIDGFEPVLWDPVADPAEAVLEFIQTQLPPEFQDVSHHWQLSSSAGAPGNENKLKAHIWFWANRPVHGHELDAWARWRKVPVDVTVFRTVQIHYTAAPVFDAGVTDPVGRRSAFAPASRDEVAIVLAPDEWVYDAAPVERGSLRDPTLKSGVIGAFCRAYDPRRAVDELLPDVFTWESDDNDVRLTWLQGGGNPGGACVTDDGAHVFNSHATDPFEGRACNTWDLVRVHRHGHLDAGASDFELDSMSTTPSYVAMREWARTLPDVQAELLDDALAPPPRADEEPPEAKGATPDAARSARAETGPADEEPVRTPVHDDRAGQLARMLAAIERSPTTQDLEHRLAPALRALELSDGDRVQMVGAVRERFRALTKQALPVATARSWLTPVAGTTGWTHLNESDRLMGTLENVAEVLRRLEATPRYNTMSKDDELIFAKQSFSVDNRANVGLALVLSECNVHDMKINVGAIKAFVNVLAEKNQYNPPLDWILSKPWDGLDRLQAWYDTIGSPNRDLKQTLMWRWGLQCVAILYNQGADMARAVLTFTGVQYAGKTRWLKALAPEGLVLAGHILDVHNKDSVKKAISYWITELGELDGTLRKSDLAALKAFISQMEDELRLPYAAASSKYPRRTVFGATVNEAEFLRDPTGNTRYWAIQVDTINADHDIDMQQLWAQVHLLWLNEGSERRLPHWLTGDEMKLLNTSNEDFTETDPLEELVRTRLDWASAAPRVWASATQIGERLGRIGLNRFEAARIGAVVRRVNGNQFRKSNGVRLLQVPAPATDDEVFAEHEGHHESP